VALYMKKPGCDTINPIRTETGYQGLMDSLSPDLEQPTQRSVPIDKTDTDILVCDPETEEDPPSYAEALVILALKQPIGDANIPESTRTYSSHNISMV